MSYLWIPGQLPDYTRLLDAALSPKGRYVYQRMKDGAEQTIGFQINRQRFKVTGEYFTYLFVEPNRRRDPSNFVSGGIKVIEDAFRRAKLIRNDGWSDVRLITPYWITCDYTSGVMVWAEGEPLSYAQAFMEFLNGPGNEEKRDQALAGTRPRDPNDGRDLAAAVKAPRRRSPRKGGNVGR